MDIERLIDVQVDLDHGTFSPGKIKKLPKDQSQPIETKRKLKLVSLANQPTEISRYKVTTLAEVGKLIDKDVSQTDQVSLTKETKRSIV